MKLSKTALIDTSIQNKAQTEAISVTCVSNTDFDLEMAR